MYPVVHTSALITLITRVLVHNCYQISGHKKYLGLMNLSGKTSCPFTVQTHTHTHTHTRARARANTRTLSLLTHTHTHPLSHTRTHAPTRTHTLTHTNVQKTDKQAKHERVLTHPISVCNIMLLVLDDMILFKG